MNSIKKFMNLLENKRTGEAWTEMTSILKESHQYFQNIPTSERGLVLNILFNERTGIINFLNYAIDESHINKNLEATIVEMFNFLIFLINEFTDVYFPHVKTTQAVCTFALTIKASFYLKVAATKAFVLLIKTFTSYELDFNDTVVDWVKKFKFYNLGERRLLLEVITTISKYFPQTPVFVRYAKAIRGQIMADVAQLCDGTTKTRSVYGVVTYIEATNNILYNFPPTKEEIGKISGPDKFYKRFKDFCTREEYNSNKQLMTALVRLFAEHLSIFDEFVYEDYEFWHKSLKSFVKRQLYGDESIRALKKYYETMGMILGAKNSENDKKIFLNLKNTFEENLLDPRISSNDLRLAVYGFSQIIQPCKNYFADVGVEEMFSLIAHRTIPRYAREDDEDARFEEIADYQEALSKIIRYMSNVTIDQIRALTTLCSLLIKRFPELSFADQEYATSSLNRTIVNVSYTKEILYQDFISHIVYDGIVWSCSHMLLIDAELKQDVEKLSKRPITYKDYVKLWQSLLNPANYSSSNENSEARAAALQRVIDETITTCITLTNTLNLNVKSKENNIFTDVKVSQTVENQSDFRIFLNLVDLYVEILANIEHHLWTNTLQKFIYEIIKNSYKNPLISGFYKLVNVILTSSGAFESSDIHNLTNETYNLVLRYLWNTLDSVSKYPQELQISCLKLILNVPERFVKRIVERSVTAFEISFKIGLTNYEIATCALNALERWTKLLGNECPKDFIGKLVPRLEKYLKSDESSTQLLNDIEEIKRDKVKRVTLINDDVTIEGFQKRILLFFGSLDSDAMLDFIHVKSLKSGGKWSKNDLLKYSLPFPDISLDIYLDIMLPRVIELALNSGDRRTRVTASEVLHTIVAFMLGKAVPFLSYDPDRFTSLYKILCPALLRLGCDSDNVIMQLYNPLMIQLTHWLTSRLMLNSYATINLVDCLFDGLSDETNSSLRDVSGIYLAEFVHWSIKQSSDREIAQSPTNIKLIVQRIINFALDPSSNKRVAAAIAFNHLYKILRENEEIVDVFWFELLHGFVKSLDGCDDSRIFDALRHVERVLLEKLNIFEQDNPRRLKPSGFSGVKSEDAVKWIFRQCGSLDRNCRMKCVNLFENLSKTLKNSANAKSTIDEFLKNEGIQALNDIMIGDLNDKFQATSAEGLEILLKTLDLYVWILSEKLVDHEIIFSNLNPSGNIIFKAIGNFLNALLIFDDTMENHSSIGPQEFVRIKTLRCEILLTIFDLIPFLLDVKATKEDFVPDYLFDEGFFKILSLCLIEPDVVGFDSSNLQLTEVLPSKIENLLCRAIEKLSQRLVNSMKNVFANDIQRFSNKLFQFDEMIQERVSISEKFLKGLILLRKCNILKLCNGCSDITENADIKITKIFDTLSIEELGENLCFNPKNELKIYFQRLMELLLLDYDTKTMKIVIELLTNTRKLYRSDFTTTVTQGEYFLSIFKDVLIRGFLRDVEETLNLLENKINQNPDDILRITEALVLYLQRNRNEYREILDKSADLVLKKCNTFERAVNNIEHRRNVFLNIYAIVVRLKRVPLEIMRKRDDIYRWILKELVESKKFKYKIRLLRDFLICLTDETSNDNPELQALLYSLKNERKITCPEDSSEEKIATPETIDCFQNLLKLLTITRSTIVFDALMNYSQGIGKILCENKVMEYLKIYYNYISTNNVLKSLELAYKRFMNSNDVDDRFDVLFYFLLPSFGCCDSQTMENFFEHNIREIYSMIMEKPTEILQDRERLFVSKIGCYNLVEIMFAKIPKERLDSNEWLLTIETASQSMKNEKFSKCIFRSTLPIRQLKRIEGDDKELFRRMQCAAYNCSIAIVSMTKNEKFYLAVFGENRERNQLIWENIIDVERRYELRQTSKEYPKQRKKLINIRKSEKELANHENYSYVKSYDLATSTLSDNISAYDLNAVNLLAEKDFQRDDETMSLTLEVDDLNDHECMASICGLLFHMLKNEITRSTSGGSTLPKWMTQFRNSMHSIYSNVRLFMLKIILNTQAVFKPYAEFFFESIINTICKILKNEALNYVITDTLVMLVDWKEISVPKSVREMNLARLMFSYLLEKGTTAPTKYIVKYNLSIVEMIVNAWHESLDIPDGLSTRISAMDRQAVRLILIFLTNGMQDKIIVRQDIWEYLERCMTDWKIEEESVLQNFEALGLMLKYSTNSPNFEELKRKIVEICRNTFRDMQKNNVTRLVKCVYTICKAWPELSEEFYQFVSSNRLKVENTNVVKCLEVFSMMIPKLSPDDIVKQLNSLQFNGLLENKVISCERICLQIIQQIVPIIEAKELLPVMKLVACYSNHEVQDYRKISYEISKKLYDKYWRNVSRELEIIEIMEISKRILLSGLLDPNDEIQKIANDFWLETTQMSDKCSERLLDILENYTCGVEKHYLQIFTLIFIQLTRKSLNYDEKLFEPLHNCNYYEHDIKVSWKTKNFESKIPLFASSLAGQWSQRFTQQSYAIGSSFHDDNSQMNLMLRATSSTSPLFEATFLGERSTPGNIIEDGIFAVPKIPEITRNKVSRRFLANWSDINRIFKQKEAARKFSEAEYRREYEERQRSGVKLYRKYRIGDFPDIEISHSSLLGPMEELVKKDPVICKNLIVCLIRSLIDRIGIAKNRYCHDLSVKLTNILKKRRGNGGAIPTIFEIFFNANEIDFPWEIVSEVSKADGLFAQGALLIERSLINGKEDVEPPAKRSRIENIETRNIDRWMELADLYESMNEVDVALSIYQGSNFSDELHVASASRAAADWEKAEKSYKKAFEMEIDVKMKKHCLEGMFECMSRLGKWKKLEMEIDSKIKPNFSTTLDIEETNNDRWIVPWIFRVHTHRILDDKPNDLFVDALQTYLQNSRKSQRLKELFAEEIAVIVVKNAPEISREFLNSCCEKIREEWIELSDLAVPLRSSMIFKLQGICDIDFYLKTIESQDVIENSRILLNCWMNKGPRIDDDLLIWDKHLSYRSYFTSCLIQKIRDSESEENLEIIDKLKRIKIVKALKLIDCALNQRNDNIAKKYLLNVEREMNDCKDQELIDEFEVNAVRWKFLNAEKSEDPKKSLKYYVASWETAHKLLRIEGLSKNSLVKVRKIISDMSSLFAVLSTDREDFFENLRQLSTIVQDTNGERIFDNVTDSLNYYSFSNLKKCCEIASEIGECHFNLSKYCYEKMREIGDVDCELSREFVSSTLKAMRYGIDEATHYFPCLLSDDLLNDEETREIFKAESDCVEIWRFLIWQTQLLSHLGSSIDDLVLPIVKRIIETYPNALIYSLRLIFDTKAEIRNDSSIKSIINSLNDKKEFNRFLEAMEYVVQPELYLDYHLKELLRNLSKDKKKAIDDVLRKVYPENNSKEFHSTQGDIYRRIAPYKTDIEGLMELSIEDTKKSVIEILMKLEKSLKKRKIDKTTLRDYSPWLEEFVGRDIEVPGQYCGDKKPNPKYHAKIIKIQSSIKAMESKRRPIRITIVANDAKNYRFLVKFGEDLRLDQRVQQIFNVTNKILKSDANCSQRRLSIDTYQVFPLSGALGFLQWIDGTKTLNDYIYFTADDLKRIQHQHLSKEYEEWIGKSAPGKNKALQYREAMVKYTSNDVVAKMIDLNNKIDWDLLRNTFVTLSPSMESFMSLRENFTTSYGTMCIAQWILGVGDRHLGNILIAVESGRSIGIDFASAFGGALAQSVPELLPFRLTAQIKGLLKPFDEYDLMGATMIHVLRALRNGRGPLLACLNVVAHEQLNWEEHVNKLSSEMENEETDVQWLPAKKLTIVSKKLNGGKPSSITLEQLAERHSDKDYFHRYTAIVNGTDTDDNSKRSLMKEENLSPEEQVRCLIEQATDLNILGRTYSGWTPWL